MATYCLSCFPDSCSWQHSAVLNRAFFCSNTYPQKTPINSLLFRYEEGGSLEYGEYIYSAGTLSCRELPVSHYPDATDSDPDQEHLQQAFERYGAIREIPFL